MTQELLSLAAGLSEAGRAHEALGTRRACRWSIRPLNGKPLWRLLTPELGSNIKSAA